MNTCEKWAVALKGACVGFSGRTANLLLLDFLSGGDTEKVDQVKF